MVLTHFWSVCPDLCFYFKARLWLSKGSVRFKLNGGRGEETEQKYHPFPHYVQSPYVSEGDSTRRTGWRPFKCLDYTGHDFSLHNATEVVRTLLAACHSVGNSFEHESGCCQQNPISENENAHIHPAVLNEVSGTENVEGQQTWRYFLFRFFFLKQNKIQLKCAFSTRNEVK